MVPDGWKSLKLAQLELDISDGNYSAKYPRQEDFVNSGIPFLRANNIKLGSVIDEDMRFISDELHKDLKKGHLKKGDIIITTRGDLGNLALVPDRHIGSNINAQLVRLNGSKFVINNYLYYCLDNSALQGEFEKLSTGTALKQLPVGKLKSLTICFPTCKIEQIRIAEILSTWDKSIEATERLLENSKKRKKALMQQLLTGKKRLPGFHEKWDFRKFDMLFEVVNDKSLQIKSSDYLSSGQYPIVDQGKELVSGFSNSLPYNNLPVIVFGDHTRCLKWVDFSFVPGADGTQILRGSKNLLTNFGFFMLEATPIPNLGYSRHMRELKELEFRVPLDLKEQEAISVILATETNLIKKLDFKIESLKSEKKALMQQLLTGKKRVKVEEAA